MDILEHLRHGSAKTVLVDANYHDICVCGAFQINFLQPFSNAYM